MSYRTILFAVLLFPSQAPLVVCLIVIGRPSDLPLPDEEREAREKEAREKGIKLKAIPNKRRDAQRKQERLALSKVHTHLQADTFLVEYQMFCFRHLGKIKMWQKPVS